MRSQHTAFNACPRTGWFGRMAGMGVASSPNDGKIPLLYRTGSLPSLAKAMI